MLVLKKANGYATSLDVWIDYNFPYIGMKPNSGIIKVHISIWCRNQQNKIKNNIKIWFLTFFASLLQITFHTHETNLCKGV